MQGLDKRLGGLDGLRAFAVFAVVLFHWGKLPGGWLGVWVFFVLSGFVNTRSLLDHSFATRREAILDFYNRRARRILPLYVAVVAFGLAVLFLFYRNKPEFGPALAQFPWLLGAYNFCRMPPGSENYPVLSHLWSLSVETQFYLLLPFAVIFLNRRAFRFIAGALMVLGPFARGILGAWLAKQHWAASDIGTAIFFFSPVHIDAFAAGAYVAVLGEELTVGTAIELATVATGLVIACFTLLLRPPAPWMSAFDLAPYGNFREAWVYSAANLLTMALVAEVSLRRTFLAWSPLQFLGKRSYGIYMIHYPLLWAWGRLWLRLHLPDPGGWLSLAPYCLVLIGLCCLSYPLERRFWGPSTKRSADAPDEPALATATAS